jgi:hypothetical protein
LRPEAEWTGGGNEAEWLEQRAVSKAQDWRTGVVSVAGADLIASEDRLACPPLQRHTRSRCMAALCAHRQACQALRSQRGLEGSIMRRQVQAVPHLLTPLCSWT